MYCILCQSLCKSICFRSCEIESGNKATHDDEVFIKLPEFAKKKNKGLEHALRK